MTEAVSAKKACANAWWRYARSIGTPSARIPIVVSRLKKEGWKCSSEPAEEPSVPDGEVEMVQGLLPFQDGERLDSPRKRVMRAFEDAVGDALGQ